jgi:ABC-type glycerol-3-phosphate transport system substrate-binding protein
MGLLNVNEGSCFWYGLDQIVWAFGGTFLSKDDPYTSNLNTPEVAAGMQWFGDIDQVHHVGWEKGFDQSGPSGNPHNLGIIAQFYSHNSKLPRLPVELQPKLEVLGVPVGPAGEAWRKIPVTVEGDSVGAQSKVMDQTLKFFDYLNNTSDFVAKYCEIYAKEVPRSDLLGLPHLQDRRHKAWADLGTRYGDPADGWHPKWSEIRNIIIEAHQRVVINYERAEDVLQDAHADAQAILDDWKAEGGEV